jgi:hypothetical protein
MDCQDSALDQLLPGEGNNTVSREIHFIADISVFEQESVTRGKHFPSSTKKAFQATIDLLIIHLNIINYIPIGHIAYGMGIAYLVVN